MSAVFSVRAPARRSAATQHSLVAKAGINLTDANLREAPLLDLGQADLHDVGDRARWRVGRFALALKECLELDAED
jgi:hypothetical protein